MGLREDFIKEAKRDNWTFSLKKSSLGPLIQTLGVLAPIPAIIASEVVKLPDAKVKKYKKALKLLYKRIPGLDKLVAAHQNTRVGQTDQIYLPGKEVRRKDADGRWFTFELQEKGNSCGCASVRAVLKAFTNLTLPSEQEIRDVMSLHERGEANQGKTKSNHDWENIGSVVPSLVMALKNWGVRDARSVVGHPQALTALQGCSGNHPGIVGWWWGPFGDNTQEGHWTVCVGPSKDLARLVLLDPWNGVQYVDAAQYWEYTVDNGAHGWFNPNDRNDPAVVVTYPA